MGQVSAASSILIDAERAGVLGAVADYQHVRPKILSPHYRDYQVLQGGQGHGTVAKWTLQATKSRVRDVQASVDVAGHTVIGKRRQLDHGHQLDGRSRRTRVQRHRQNHMDRRVGSEGFLRENVRTAGPEEEPVAGAGQAKTGAGRVTGLA